MKNLLLLTTFLFSTTFTAFGQCAEDVEPKVLLIGDSWAFFMNTDGTFDNVFEHWGQSNMNFFSNAVLAVNGAETQDFLVEAKMTEIENQLDSQPSIEAVHVSLGGNDFLGAWNVDLTPAETEALSDETYDEVFAVIDFIKSVRPDIQIVFSGYMYANFAEVIDDAAPLEASHPFYGTWEGMGFPTFAQLNTLLNDFSDRLYDASLLDAQIDFIHVPGLMQHIYGQEEPLGVDPGGTYAPFFQPLPYGDITYPSPKVAMRDYGLVRDCFHLSVDGYYKMIDYQFQKFYHKFFMDDIYYLAELDDRNGTVDSEGEVGPALIMGSVGLLEQKIILSFDTDELADTVITAANIFLRREGIYLDNPLGTEVLLTMKIGELGSESGVDADDFSDAGDISETACVFGMNEEDTDWIRIDLPESFLPLIETSFGIIEFSIGAADGPDGFISFTNGADSEFAPVFNIMYKGEVVGLAEQEIEVNDFIVFPNPAKDQLNIFTKGKTYDRVEIINLQGQTVIASNVAVQQLNISDLKAGQYLIRFSSVDGVSVQQFVKR
ncbi:MAG: T9SS type A sorting domain-containing protein [Crocinitomix sp.]|nr:T9SS type A sorting domain-containing protein [Crocinitomix sp.]